MVFDPTRKLDDYRFRIDCFLRPDPGDLDEPFKTFGYDTRDEALTHVFNMQKAGHYKKFELFDGASGEYLLMIEWTWEIRRGGPLYRKVEKI